MSVDEIVETISEMEDYSELMRIATAIKSRANSLSRAAMARAKQKFKMGDRITIKDETGKVWNGIFRGFAKRHVRLIVNNAEIKVNPTDLERLEAEVVDRPVPQEVHKMTPEEIKKREDAVDKMLGKGRSRSDG